MLGCIDTYLIDVSGEAMVEPSIWRAEAAIDLIAQSLRRGQVDFLPTRQIVHVEESVAEANIVDRVTVVVEQDLASESRVQLNVDLDKTVRSAMVPLFSLQNVCFRSIGLASKCLTYVLLDKLQVLCVVCALIGELHARKQGRDEVVVSWVDAVLDLAVGHPGQVARLAMECVWRDFSGRWDSEPAIGQRYVGCCEDSAGECQLQERRFHGI